MHVDRRHFGETQDRIALPASLVMPAASNRTASFSAQLVAWIAPPSICARTPSGLIGQPDVDRDRQPPHAQLRAGLDLGHHGAPGAAALVAREGQAVADAVGARA